MTISLDAVLNARQKAVTEFAPAKRDTPWSIGGGQAAQAQEPIKLPEGSLLPSDPEVRQGLVDIATQAKINPALLLALAHQESGYNATAVGSQTKWGQAKGMFQFLDTTASGHGIDAMDWKQAGMAAAKDLAEQIAREGVDWAVAHHHGGGNKKLHGPKTAKYAREVLMKAAAIAEELGIPLDIPASQMPDLAAENAAKGISLEDVLKARNSKPTDASEAGAAKSTENSEESLLDTIRSRAPGSMANPVATAVVDGVRNTIERGWEGIQNFLNRETEIVERSDDEIRRLWETEGRNSPHVLRTGMSFEQWAANKRSVRVSTKPFAEEEAEWTARLQANPEDAHMLPRRLAHLRPKADDSRFAPSNTLKGVMQRFAANHRNPIELLLQESIPADLVTTLFTLPELERKKFDQARAVSKAMEVANSPDNHSDEEIEQANNFVKDWKKSVDPSISAAWEQLWQAAKEDPAAVATGLSEALWADPYMAVAPLGVGMKPVRAMQAANKIGAPTIAGRAGKIADSILDGSITTASINVAAGLSDNLAEFGKVNNSEVKLNAAIGALTGGVLGPIFMGGARARSKSIDAHKAQGTLDEALRDMAKADVEMEAQAEFAYQRIDPDFGTGDKISPTQQRIADLLGIQTQKDATAWKNQRRKEIKEAFSDQPEYADYLRYVAEERIARTEQLVAEREAQVRRKAEAAYGSTPESAAVRQARLAEEFEAAVAARNAAEEAGDLDASWRAAQAEDQAFTLAKQLDAEEMYYAALSQDAPTIKQVEAKIARRNDALGRHRRKRGELGATDPKVLAAMGITAAGATAGAAMFPKEPEKGMLAGAILSGLSAVGLGKARGGRSPGSLRRISQEGALKPKGGNWVAGAADEISPHTNDFEHTQKVTQRYLNRYAGTADDPLKDLELPDGTRWEDAMDIAITQDLPNQYGETPYRMGGGAGLKEVAVRASGHTPTAEMRSYKGLAKIRSYMNHVGDYLRTLPESEVVKMDFVRMVKETKRWDDANARRMEKAQVKLFKDAEVLKEYDDGFKWIRLNKPGQFANESDLMGHSVRGYEPSRIADDAWGDVPGELVGDVAAGRLLDDDLIAQHNIRQNPDWTSDAVGGHPDYGYGGWDAIKSDRARVYSLRDSKGKPVATVELGKMSDYYGGGFEINQIKGPRNNPVNKKYADKIQDFLSTVKKDLGGTRLDVDPLNDNARYDLSSIREGWGNEAGKADPELMARLGVVGAGAAAGIALFPEDEKLAGGLLGGLAGLLAPAGGSVLSRFRQAGAIDANGNIIAGLVKAGKMANKLDEAEIRVRDQALVEATRAGDQQAFKVLYDSYKPSLERYAKKFTTNRESATGVDAEDIAQRAMLNLYQKIVNDPEFVPDNLPAFLRTLTKNEAVKSVEASNTLKREADVVNESQYYKEDLYEGDMGSSRSILDDTTGEVEGNVIQQLPDTPEAAMARAEVLDIIRQAIDGMPEQHQQIFAMAILEHFTPEEIADQLGLKRDNVYKTLQRIEERVRNAVAENRRKLGEEPDVSQYRMARGQRGAVSPELLTRTAAIGAAITVAGAAGYFMSDGKIWNTVMSGALGGPALYGLGKARLKGSNNVIKGDLGGANIAAVNIRAVDWRLKDMGEALWGLTKKHGMQEFRAIKEYNDATANFIHIFQHLPKDLKPIIIDALSTRDKGIINKMLDQVGGREFVDAFESVRKKLDEVEDTLVDLGLIKKSEKDYFPFRVKDLDGLKAHLGKDAAGSIDEALTKAKEALKRRGDIRELTEIERDIIINKVLEPYLGKPISAHTPGFAKARTIQRITPELQKFYHDPVATLNSYGVQSAKYIERAKFFGKHLKRTKNDQGKLSVNIGDSIGAFVKDLKDRGDLTDIQATQLAGMLQDRFNGGEMASSSAIRDIKNVTNGSLLGNIYSASTQLGDIAFQARKQGLIPTIKAMRRILTRDKLIDLKNYGIEDHIAHEFLSDGWARKYADTSLKWGGFRAIDRLGKNFGLNAAVERMMQDALTDKGKLRLADKFQRAYPEDFDKAMAALKRGEVNESVELLAYGELTQYQPLTAWELPQMYHRLPDGRVIYQLQTFNIRFANALYEESLKDIASMKPKRMVQGVQALLGLASVYALQGVATDKIKDFLAGKQVEFDAEEIPINLVNMLGVGPYDYQRMTERGLLEGLWDSKKPPIFRISEDLWKEPERSIRLAPVVGRPLYNYTNIQWADDPAAARADSKKGYWEQRRRERRKREGYKMEITVPPKKEGSSSSSGRGSRGNRGSRGSR